MQEIEWINYKKKKDVCIYEERKESFKMNNSINIGLRMYNLSVSTETRILML